ncbi:hypothetical protein [Streptomyces sp. I05A-00742]|uniref:hypothetical protein n=1 Tax=Streptomyces sp. I05A-00742 TaxID=2732853 RepID=UPI00148773F6|nr:hypothetical protein [Streptomyces sp. I05A-00742]
MAEARRRDVVRRGRKWAPLQGNSAEINKLAAMLRTEIEAAGLTLDELYARLVPEHFGGQVPSRATIARRLSGVRLENDWAFVDAVIDITSDNAARRSELRLLARQLWRRAQLSPTPHVPSDEDEGADAEEVTVSVDAAGVPGPRAVIEGSTIHGTVHITNNFYGVDASSRQAEEAVELRALRQRVVELEQGLRIAHEEALERTRKLASALRLLETAPSGWSPQRVRAELLENVWRSEADAPHQESLKELLSLTSEIEAADSARPPTSRPWDE